MAIGVVLLNVRLQDEFRDQPAVSGGSVASGRAVCKKPGEGHGALRRHPSLPQGTQLVCTTEMLKKTLNKVCCPEATQQRHTEGEVDIAVLFFQRCTFFYAGPSCFKMRS